VSISFTVYVDYPLVFFTVCRGDGQQADSEEFFAVCDKNVLEKKTCDIT